MAWDNCHTRHVDRRAEAVLPEKVVVHRVQLDARDDVVVAAVVVAAAVAGHDDVAS